MEEFDLPQGIPPLYRGGQSLEFRTYDVRIDRMTGLLKTNHGVSLDADPHHVARFGGAYLVRRVPQGLAVIQRGSRAAHYELVPAYPMRPETYEQLLKQVELELFAVEK